MEPPVFGTTEAAIAARRRELLAWYDVHARDLPWRRRPSLYGTWIAEVMLQQTTVATVIPRWPAFLRRFPDVAALAAADEAAVLSAWSGLGYYRRARLLHRAAREIVDRHAGRLPATQEGWRALPGIGAYAAGAIASIGLGLPTAAVDANVTRVLTRWMCADGKSAGRLTASHLRDLAAAHVPAQRAGDWNQAVMDLGAGRCRAGEPDCAGCPVRARCAAGSAGTGGVVPPPAPRVAATSVMLSGLVLRSADDVLLLPSEESVVARARGLGRPRRADLTGLFAGMLGVPSTPWYPAEASKSDPLLATWRRWLRGLAGGECELRAVGWIRHAITVYRMQILVCVAECASGREAAERAGGVWTAYPIVDQPVSTLARKIMQRASLPDSVPEK